VFTSQIQQLKKDLAQNLESQKDAEALREKQAEAYEGEKTEGEQCIGALEAAIGILTGAGEGKKKGFLETMQEAQLLSVAAGVRSVLREPQVAMAVSRENLELIRRFVARPEEFVSAKPGHGLQFVQNPHGDYAPQSGQIQGVLKGLYDSFTADLEKANAKEAGSVKSHEALMETKKKEQDSFETTLEKLEMDQADTNKKLSDSKTERDDAKEQLKADEIFFASTKDNCKTKAKQWSERSRLRTEELLGVQNGIAILTSPEAKETFDASSKAFFLQKDSIVQDGVSHKHRAKAYAKLRLLATKFRNVELAELAAEVKIGGHFDKIIPMIDNMMALLRREEQEDIAHRDKCLDKTRENKNTMQDLGHSIDKAKKELKRNEDDEDEIKSEIESLEDEMKESKKTIKEQKDERSDELDAFKEAHQDDLDAVALLDKAIVALSKFYKNNKIPLGFVQRADPDEDEAPEVNFQGGGSGRKDESSGIIAILTMIKEDIEKELADAAKADGAGAIFFGKNKAALEETLSAQEKSRGQAKKSLAELQAKMADTTEYKDAKDSDLDAEKETKKALDDDCGWIETDFDKRRDARKAEMEGLVEAQTYLMGVDSDDDA